jgi:hypothetical protein
LWSCETQLEKTEKWKQRERERDTKIDEKVATEKRFNIVVVCCVRIVSYFYDFFRFHCFVVCAMLFHTQAHVDLGLKSPDKEINGLG